MSVLSEFRSALIGLGEPDLARSELLPLRLAIGAAQAVSADAAGISVMDVLRVPLGASSADADIVERLQITIGDGPCIHAFGAGEPVAATQDEIAATWPIFNDRMLAETRIRSVAAVPLRTATAMLGALDLYWSTPEGASTVSLAAAAELGDLIAGVLLAEPEVTTELGVIGPGWVDAAAAQRRMQVWQAVGMINYSCAVSNVDAIALLRAYAYGHDTTIDDLADDLVNGRVPLHDVVPQTSTT